MSNQTRGDELDIQLELKDRLPYTSILTASLLNLKRAINTAELNYDLIQTLILDFFTDIPRTWQDDKFRNDVEACITTRTVSAIPSFAGVPLDAEICKAEGIQTVRTVQEIDYFALKNSIINLLDRLNLLIRKEKIEYSTGLNLEDNLETLGKKFDAEQTGEEEEPDEWSYSAPSEEVKEFKEDPDEWSYTK